MNKPIKKAKGKKPPIKKRNANPYSEREKIAVQKDLPPNKAKQENICACCKTGQIYWDNDYFELRCTNANCDTRKYYDMLVLTLLPYSEVE